MRQRRWLKLIKDYDLEIHYHPGKANVVADALSCKASFHCLTVRTPDTTLCQEMENLNLGIVQQGTLTHLKLESVILQRIIDAQRTDKGMKYIHEKMEAGKANCFRKDDHGVIWFKDRIVVPKDAEVRQQVLDEAHLSRYSIHPGSTKIYQDLKQHYWWTKMKIEIARCVEKCDTCRRVKAIHMKAAGPLQSLPIPT
jgi:phosphomannomutase